MNKDVENFCQNIKRIRETKGLSKRKMAEYCGISVYNLNRIEQGILPPKLSYKIFLNINKNFGITPSKMFQ